MTTMQAADDVHAELARVVTKFAKSGVDADHYATLIEEAFERAQRQLPKIPELSEKAARLAAPAADLASALNWVCDFQVVDLEKDGPLETGRVRVTRQGPRSIWPILEIARTLGESGFGDDIPGALQFSRCFRKADIGAPIELMFRLQRLAEEAKIVSSLSDRGRPVNLDHARLLAELRMYWRDLTEELPKKSGAATWDKPRSHFGHFLKGVLELSSLNSEERIAIFRAGAVGRENLPAK